MEGSNAPDGSNGPPPQGSADGRSWSDGEMRVRAAGAASVSDQPAVTIGSLRVDDLRIPRYRPPSELSGIPSPPEPQQPAPAPARVTDDASWNAPAAFAPQGQPKAHGGRVRGQAWRTACLVLAAIALAVPIAYFTAGALNVGDDTTQAKKALQSGAAHTSEIADSFRVHSVDLGLVSTTQGIQAVRLMLADYGSSLHDVGWRLDSDMATLRTIDDRLEADSVNPLLWSDKRELANDQRRVEALLAGLKSARSGIGILEGQTAAFVALFDVFDSMEALVPFLDRRDVNGALAHYSTLEQRMQVLAAALNGSSFSPHFVIAVNHLKTLNDDVEQLLEALQYRNAGLLQVMLPKVKADISALSSDDLSDWGPFEQNLLRPYIDGYNSGLRAAGFDQTLTNL